MESAFWQEWKKIEDWLVGNGYCSRSGTLTRLGRHMLKKIPTACTGWFELYRYGELLPDGCESESRLKVLAVWMPYRFRGGGDDRWEYRYRAPGNYGRPDLELELEDLEKYRELFGIPRGDRFDPLDEMEIL